MKILKNFLKFTLLSALLAITAPVWAQGYHYQDIAVDTNGHVLANAKISVCTYTSGPAVVCPSTAPTASLFSDPALTVSITNPASSDHSGNFGFWVQSGNYDITITAAGFVGYSYIASIGGSSAIKPAASEGWFFWSAAGNDSNDCTSRGTACLTWAGVLSKVPANTTPHVYVVGKINVTTSGSPAIQAPIASVQSNCVLEGLSAQDNQGGSGAPPVGGAIIDLTSGSGPIFDQTVTNVSFQNIVGCKLKDITFENDPANASLNAVLVKFGGTQGETFDNIHFNGNGSSGEACWEPFNSNGMFTERIDFKIWLTNCTSGAKWVGTGASSDFTHIVRDSYYMLNEFSGQKPIEYSDANTAQTDFAILGNVTAASGARNVIYIDDANSVMNQDLIYFHVEGDGASTTFNRINNAGGSSLGNIAMWDLGATPVGQTWADVGTVSYIFKCGSPTSLTTDATCLFPKIGLVSTEGGIISHVAPSTAAAVTVTDPIATTLSPVVGTCTMTTTTCTITVVSGAAHCVATDSGGTIAGQCAISGTTLTVTAASSNTSAWSVLWW